jgi:hypothetical protein
VILWSEWNSTYLTPLHMYVGILFLWYCDQNGTVHTWHHCICKLGCQVCTVPFWSQYHKKRIPTYICSGVRYVLFHSDHSITRRGFQLTYAVVSVTPLHMQVRILFLWYCEQNRTVHTWHPCICKLESSSCDTVIRMKQYIPDTPAYLSWNPLQGYQVCTVPFWSQYSKKWIPTYICRGVRYVLFHSDHSITRRGF